MTTLFIPTGYDEKWIRKKYRILNKCNGRCAYCGEPLELLNFHMDHLVPRRLRGSDSESNLYPACESCNLYKSDSTLEEFRQRIIGQVHRMRNDLNIFNVAEKFGQITCSEVPVTFYFELNG